MTILDLDVDVSKIKLLEFERTTNAFNYVFGKDIKENEVIIVKLPVVSANKRGINDIGWLSDGNVRIYGTLAKDPNSKKALWQPIRESDEINKVTSAILVVNNGDSCRIEMRAIFN